MVARFRELDARGTYNFDQSGSRAGKKPRVPIRYSTARQPLIAIARLLRQTVLVKKPLLSFEGRQFLYSLCKT